MAQVEQRCGKLPDRLLADTGAMTAADIGTLAQTCPSIAVLSPPPARKGLRGDAELTDREMSALGRHTIVKVLPKYTKRTTRQIVNGAKSAGLPDKRRTIVRMSISLVVRTIVRMRLKNSC